MLFCSFSRNRSVVFLSSLSFNSFLKIVFTDELVLAGITAFFQTFMEEMTRKQLSVDKVTKTYKRRAADPSSLQSHIRLG